MSAEHRDLRPATAVVALGRPPRVPGAPVGPSVELTSTYVAGAPLNYARSGNPTWTAFEDAVGVLEGGTGLAFASGLGAMSAALHLAPHGSIVVVPHHAYNGTGALLAEAETTRGFSVRRMDPAATDEVIAALQGAQLLVIESPTNPMLESADLPTVFAAARAAGALSVCDNTFATPLGQQPLHLGADVVVHSATKYLSGHSDVVLGVTVTADPALHDRLLSHRTLHGAIPGPMEAWLALRGLRTLDVRWARATASAAELAGRLAHHSAVSRVRYPGSGAIIGIELAGGQQAAEQLENRVSLWLNATSLGGVESMLERRRRHPLEPSSVPDDLVRLSVGIEHVDDLWEDLAQALR